MELPPLLRRAVDRALSGMSLNELAATAAVLSQRYREERRGGKTHVASDWDALAYLAVRLPATYAAVRASFAAVAEARPDFAPKSALDIGAGPGTALWAATECWPGLADVLLVEASPIFRAFGEQLAAEMRQPHMTWRTSDIAMDEIDGEPRDLVTLAYVLNELAPEDRPTGRGAALAIDRRYTRHRRAGNASRLAAYPRRPAPADRGRCLCDCAMPACECVSAAAAGLVPFRPPRRPFAPAPASQGCGRPLGGREVQLRGGLVERW